MGGIDYNKNGTGEIDKRKAIKVIASGTYGKFTKESSFDLDNAYLINAESSILVNELISEGWSFFLNVENNDELLWEADFTRKLDSGLYDNHRSGYSKDPNVAINDAYINIKKGNRL
jgi:hypothetical protein